MRLVIFDCDGTLVDSQHLIVASIENAFRALELAPPTRDAMLRTIGLSLPEAMHMLIDTHQDRGSIKVSAAQLVEDYKSKFQAKRLSQPQAPFFPGAEAVLRALGGRDDILLGIATGKSRRGLEALMDAHNIRHYFVTTKTADDAPSKPNPEMLFDACREAGVRGPQTIMIGDTTYDMEMAVNAGVRALGVSWGYHDVQNLIEAGAERIIDHFDDLIPTLDRM